MTNLFTTFSIKTNMESKIKEYCILKSEDVSDLSGMVNNLILSEGWQPFGSISSYIRQEEGIVVFVQPMVKYKNLIKGRA